MTDDPTDPNATPRHVDPIVAVVIDASESADRTEATAGVAIRAAKRAVGSDRVLVAGHAGTETWARREAVRWIASDGTPLDGLERAVLAADGAPLLYCSGNSAVVAPAIDTLVASLGPGMVTVSGAEWGVDGEPVSTAGPFEWIPRPGTLIATEVIAADTDRRGLLAALRTANRNGLADVQTDVVTVARIGDTSADARVRTDAWTAAAIVGAVGSSIGRRSAGHDRNRTAAVADAARALRGLGVLASILLVSAGIFAVGAGAPPVWSVPAFAIAFLASGSLALLERRSGGDVCELVRSMDVSTSAIAAMTRRRRRHRSGPVRSGGLALLARPVTTAATITLEVAITYAAVRLAIADRAHPAGTGGTVAALVAGLVLLTPMLVSLGVVVRVRPRRASSRAELEFNAAVDGRPASVVDVSIGGLAVATSSAVDVGDRVGVLLDPEDGALPMIVVRCFSHGHRHIVGLQLAPDAHAAARSALERTWLDATERAVTAPTVRPARAGSSSGARPSEAAHTTWTIGGTVAVRFTTAVTLIALGAAVLPPYPASFAAGTVVVNSTGTASDASAGNGICETGTPGQCTLRAAIQEANASAMIDTIHFDIPTGDAGHSAGVWTIAETATLTVTAPVTIDATTQPGHAATPVVGLDGSGAGSGSGMAFSFTGGTVRGLAIGNYPGNGIYLENGSGVVVERSHIGVGPDGSTATPNGGSGIYIDGGADVTIGGVGVGNVLSGNGLRGVRIEFADNVSVDGNLIGVAADGSTARPNNRGVAVDSSTNVTVGGTVGNVISGNTGIGIAVTGEPLTISNNRIGTNSAGSAAVANTGTSVWLSFAGGSQILDNTISGNSGDGIYSRSGDGLVIQGNRIGVSSTAAATIPNTSDGLDLDSNGHQIGGASAGQGNVIGGNAGHGINLMWSVGTIIEGNAIGTDPSGTVDLGNGSHGVWLRDPSALTTIGGTEAGAGNVIAYNTLDGVSSPTANWNPAFAAISNSIHSNDGLGIDLGNNGATVNDVGDGDGGGPNDYLNHPIITAAGASGGTLDVDFTLDVPAGIYRIEFFDNTAADPTGYGEGETFLGAVSVSHPGGAAAYSHSMTASSPTIVTATATQDNGGGSFGATSEFSPVFTVTSSAVTVNSTGDAADTSPGDGVCWTGGNNSVGAPACSLRAAIQEANASSLVDTIHFAIPGGGPTWTISPSSELPTIAAAVTIDATTQAGWTADPVVNLSGALTTGVGGLELGTGSDGSVIAGLAIHSFDADGISIGTGNNRIGRNRIGTDSAGAGGLGNGTAGVYLWNGANNVIGGPGGLGNLITSNADGIVLDTGADSGNAFLENEISSHTDLGIDLGNNGVTANDAGDVDSGPNDLLNFPVVTGANAASGTVTVDFTLDVPAGDYRVEAFTNPSGADPSGFGEGATFETAAAISHPGGGSQSFQLTFPGSVGDVVTLTATRSLGLGIYGSTSEFSAAATAAAAPQAVVLDRIQKGVTTIANGATSHTVTIDSVDLTRSFLLVSIRGSANTPTSGLVRATLSNATTITLERTASTGAMTVEWQVLSFASGVRVQRGTATMTSATVDVAITSAATSSSFPVTTVSAPGSAFGDDDFVAAHLTSPTNLRLATPPAATTGAVVHWQVVTYDQATVQTGTVAFGTADSSRTATVSIPDTTKAWLLTSTSTDSGSTTNIGQKLVRGQITNATTLTFDRSSTGQAMTVRYHVVNFTDAATVQRGSAAFSTAATSVTPSITAIDPARSVVTGGHLGYGGRTAYTADDNIGAGTGTLHLTTGSQIRIQRDFTGSATADIPWQVITWSGAGPNVVTVNSTGDGSDRFAGDGYCDTGADPARTQCTLRAAIQEANASAAVDTIEFAIPTTDPGYSAGRGVFTITPASNLPALSTTITIDGASQAVNVANTNPGTLGYVGSVGTGPDGVLGTGDEPTLDGVTAPEIELDYAGELGLVAAADGVSISGLAVFGANPDVMIAGGANVVVEDMVIGTRADSFTNPGAGARSTGSGGVAVFVGSGVQVRDNLIGYQTNRGIEVNGTMSNLTISGNEIKGTSQGTTVEGGGIEITNYWGAGNAITGVTVTSNLIHELVDDHGIEIATDVGDSGFVIDDNSILGMRPMLVYGNPNVDGGTVSHNVLRDSLSQGIYVDGVADWTISENSITNSTWEGIGLSGTANDGITAPSITSAAASAGSITVDYSVTAPAGTYQVEFFDSSLAGGTDEGETYLSTDPITHPGGTVAYTHTVGGAPGDIITSTLTESLGGGDFGSTSMFSVAAIASTPIVVVNATADNSDANVGDGSCATSLGVCTLRAAIQEANANPVIDTIHFAIPGAGPVWTISPTTQLPAITAAVTIDATTQPGYTSTPIISIDGSGTAAGPGLDVSGDDVTVRGVNVRSFPGDGVSVTGARFTLEASHIGTNAAGTAASPNSLSGLLIGGPDATIQGNLVSGNSSNGVRVQSGGDRARIVDNRIGTTVTGNAALPNGEEGVEIDEADDVVVGEPGLGNVLSGNNFSGINGWAGDATGAVIQGNLIGIGADGVTALGNSAAVIEGGITIRGPVHDWTIGGTGPGEGNVIANNTGDGISLIDINGASDDIAVVGNSIHTNTGLGIDIDDDGVTANDAGDADTGINDRLNAPVISSAVVTTGTADVAYALDLPAGDYRVEFFTNTSADASGYGEGETFVHAETISHPGLGSAGFTTSFAGSAGDVITATVTEDLGLGAFGSTSEFSAALFAASSTVVVNSTGNASDASPGDGICETASAGQCTLRAAIQEANANTTVDTIEFDIPDADPGHAAGVWTIAPPAQLPTITEAVTIDATTQPGTTVNTATSPAPINGALAIRLSGSAMVSGSNGLILGAGSSSSEIRGLSITGFGSDAIRIDGSSDNVIAGNHIGADAAGTAAAGNSSGVIVVGSASGNRIGGNAAADRNLFAGNSYTHVGLIGSGVTGTIIQGNELGWFVGGAEAPEVGDFGIVLWNGTSANLIGGTSPGEANRIRGAWKGVLVDANLLDSSASILSNHISDSIDVGIDLLNDGVTANDGGDADTGPNDLLNFPVISSAEVSGATVEVSYSLDVPAGNYRVEFFANPSGADPTGYGEGEVFVHAEPVSALGLGAAAFTASFAGSAGDVITATVTEDLGGGSFGSTSEFSAAACTDSDGDGLWDCEEDANTDLDNDPATNPGPDTDGDSLPNYLDADDDGDGIPTASENADPDGDGDPRDALDADRDGQPDWLDAPTSPTGGYVATEQKISDTVGGLAATLESSGLFGLASTPLGDLDGDGVVDIAVSAPYTDDGGTDRGAVHVLFLNADGTVRGEQKISDTAGGLTATLDNSDIFGWAVAGIGDLDGDGRGELAVGAVLDDDGIGGAGAVHILFLNADGTVRAEQKISASEGGLTGPLGASHFFGSSIAAMGDVDGDGVVDIAVGAYNDGDGGAARGAVHVLFLNPDGTVKDEQKISSTQGGLGAALINGDTFGYAAAGLGDVDGDGTPDLAVGATGADDGGNARGAVFLLFLNPDGTVRAAQRISDTDGGLTATLDDSDQFGNALGGTGDLDGDGTVELLVGVPFDDDGSGNRGAVYILSLNPDGTVARHHKISSLEGGLTGPLDTGDNFGRSVAGLGDLDGDGTIGVVVGANNDDDGGTNRGAVYVLDLSPPPVPIAVVNSTGDAPDQSPGDGHCRTGASNSVGDPECTLRAAIEEANASTIVATIHFDIPMTDPGHAAGVWSIDPSTVLPSVSAAVALDGSSQPGWSVAPVIALDGSGLGGSTDGVTLGAGSGGSEVRSLAVAGFPGHGVVIDFGSSGNLIAGNHIGTDAAGLVDAGNGSAGILVWTDGNTIGGAAAADRNVISGNDGYGIFVGATTGNVFQGNHIGVDVTGNAALGNTWNGIYLGGGDGNVVDGNVIGDNGDIGIRLEAGSNHVITANSIGVGADGVADVGNLVGISARFGATDIVIGGSDPSDANVIADNGHGVLVMDAGTARVAIIGNEIRDNDDLGIDLDDDGVTANDPGDADTGPNDHVNFPVITSATARSGLVDITFDLDVPAGSYRIELFANPSGADPTGYGEGEVLVDGFTVTHPGGGRRTYTTRIPGTTGDVLTATATEDLGGGAFGATSEFSQAATVGAAAATVRDLSPRRSDLVTAGGAAGPGGAGVAATGVTFGGGNQRLVGPATDLTSGAVTLSAWVQLDVSSTSPRLVSKRAQSGAIYELLVDDVTGAAEARFGIGGGEVTVQGGALAVGTWHQVAATWDGSMVRLYVDGAEVAQAPASGALATDLSTPLVVGNVVGANRGLIGSLDTVQVAHTARSSAWIETAYLNQSDPTGFVSVGEVETAATGSWSASSTVMRNGGGSLAAPAAGAGAEAWATATGLDEPGLAFESWWYVTSPATSRVAAGTNAGATPIEQRELGATDGTVDLATRSVGGRTVDASSATAVPAGTWTRVEIRTDELGRSTAWIDGAQVIGPTPHSGGTSAGTAGLRAGAVGAGGWYVDDVRIRRYVSDEPTTSLGPLHRN